MTIFGSRSLVRLSKHMTGELEKQEERKQQKI